MALVPEIVEIRPVHNPLAGTWFAQSVHQLIEIGLAMEAAGCIVLCESRNLELIGVDQFMPRADLYGDPFRAFEFDRGKCW